MFKKKYGSEGTWTGDGGIILKRMFKKKYGSEGTWTGLIRIRAGVGALVYA
jgi:hypothetical protein